MAARDDSLASFHPLVREWFLSRYGSPTAVQAAAWPLIAAGGHVLALAPTGSGKTLTAFLGAISRIASGELPADRLSVLYVSPLKALSEDIRRNLESPIGELATLFGSRGADWPGIRAATRNGDTSQADRRRMLRSPPTILATTPESLALMLDSPASRGMLADVRLLVLDEIHALAGDKRGAMLACSVGRLALLAGEFQRLALSATARPVKAIADFVGGRRLVRGPEGKAEYRRRAVSVVAPASEKRIELSVEWPEVPHGDAENEGKGALAGSGAAPRYTQVAKGDREQSVSSQSAPEGRYAAIIPEVARKMGLSKGIIVFTDSRRRAERMAFLINEAAGEGAAWAHHGSLSKEARRVVEERFKAGELPCVVATASLELGIDIGSVDEVFLAGTPPAVASALQRIGRSGHGVGEVSKGTIYPFHGMDLVMAAAAAKGVEERAVEETKPLSCPLDVLAQLLLELITEGPRTVDAVYEIVLSFPPFERLTRSLFDSTLWMLAGKYSGTRLRELEPRIAIDAATGTVHAGRGARGLLYSSGGTIPDRGLFSMRVAGSKTRIGELDEEFVWERRVGEVFTLGAQAWRITEIGSEAVLVVPAAPDPDIVPFWKGEARYRSPEISERALDLLDALGELDTEDGAAALVSGYGFSPGAAEACSRFVASQKAAGPGRGLGRYSLPGSRRLVLEKHEEAGGRGDSTRLVLHTLRGLAINEPLAFALSAAMEEDCGLPVQRVTDDDLILLAVPRVEGLDPVDAFMRAFRSLAEGEALDRQVKTVLEGSGLFGAQFRENAGRALLLPRGMPGKRTPLWMTRLRAKKLFEAVRGSPDFPVIVETWRSCLVDLFDLDGARELAARVADGRVEISSFSSRAPSPFAREALWKETGENMYRGDELRGRASSSVSDRVIAEALRSARLRPRIDPGLAADFEARLKRLVPGWAPDDCLALAEWTRERVLIPVSELPAILASAGPALAAAFAADPDCGGRLLRLTLPGAAEEVLVHAERASAISADPVSHIAEWLRREAVVAPARITALFGVAGAELDDELGDLVEEGTIVADLLVDGTEGESVIDAQNLEILLRRARTAARPVVAARPPEDLARLVFAVQGLNALADGHPSAEGHAALERALGALAGAAAPAALWEAELLPARIPGFRRADLDAALTSSPWQWFGAGRGRVSIARAEDLELFLPSRRGVASSGSRLIPVGGASLDFWTIRERAGIPSSELARALWAEAWRGLVASDSFRDLRDGIANGFGTDLPASGNGAHAGGGAGAPGFGARRRVPRALRERWKGGAPTSGRWFRLDLSDEAEETEPDALDEASLDVARVRALASRYGLLCRGILECEEEGLRWGDLFPAMRRLELAGELLAGRFFETLEGPQFLDPAAFGLFKALDAAASGGPVWVNSLDPAAAALYAPVERQALLPPRIAANRICVDGGLVVAVSTRSFRDLALALSTADPRLSVVLGIFRAVRVRDVGPERRVVVDRVNGEVAARSPFAEALREAGLEADRGRMVLW
ncbi:MAG: DEAD/DEAH box helicase [Rectinemataceae bacterium]|jgi:ATP-dependent Lhr-like helicase